MILLDYKSILINKARFKQIIFEASFLNCVGIVNGTLNSYHAHSPAHSHTASLLGPCVGGVFVFTLATNGAYFAAVDNVLHAEMEHSQVPKTPGEAFQSHKHDVSVM